MSATASTVWTTEGPLGVEIVNPIFGVEMALDMTLAESLAHARVSFPCLCPNNHVYK
jgi:hypothetical protein